MPLNVRHTTRDTLLLELLNLGFLDNLLPFPYLCRDKSLELGGRTGLGFRALSQKAIFYIRHL